ncbi:MAG TPA: hypothetical protein VH437_00820 [Terriglobales bacterium]
MSDGVAVIVLLLTIPSAVAVGVAAAYGLVTGILYALHAQSRQTHSPRALAASAGD